LGDASKEFFERAGNLLILPYGNETIWFENSEGKKVSFLGQHGGLNEQEMLVPFSIAKLSNLKKENTAGTIAAASSRTSTRWSSSRFTSSIYRMLWLASARIPGSKCF
jgi:hypothetical protein